MGRAVLIAAEFPFSKVVGVEFSAELHRIAGENLARRRDSLRAGAVELACQDAGEYVFPAGNAVVYMFNPFQDAVMTRVLNNMLRAFEDRPADLIIVYFNPVHGRLLDSRPSLARIKTAEHYSVYRRLPQIFTPPAP